MAGNANESYLFIIDVSPTMGSEDLVSGSSDADQERVTKLEQALAYVELKVTQFIMRGLKTLEVGIMIFGSSKTRNELSDNGRDGYEGIRLLVPITTADNATLERVQKIKPAPEATAHPADLLSAVICGADCIISHVGTKKRAKNLILVTDAESATSWDHTSLVSTASHMNANGVELTVVGINFDDPDSGFKEEDKSEVKGENEGWLQNLMGSLDNSLMGNLDYALKSASGPQLRIPRSNPIKMSLSIGNVREHPDTSLSLQIDYRKAVAKSANPRAYKLSMLDVKPERPPPHLYDPHLAQTRLGEAKIDTDRYALSCDEAKQGLEALEQMFVEFNRTSNRREAVFERELEKLEQEEADRTADVDEATQTRQEQTDTMTHEASRGFSRYIVSDTEAHGDQSKATPTPAPVQGSSKDGTTEQAPELKQPKTLSMDVPTSKAYMYGGTIVPIVHEDAELALQLELNPGIEVMGFTNKQNLRREWIMGEIGYVSARANAPTDEVLFSALCSSLEEKGRFAIVRYIGTSKGHPLKVGLLMPRSTPTTQYLIFVQMPFAEDLRKPKFPSLTRLITVKGKKLTEHPTIPTEEQNKSMAKFVDAMDLDQAGADDDGLPAPWYSQTDSYNTAIHNITMAIAYRHAHPLDPQLPVPHPELLKYMLPPPSVSEKAADAFANMKESFDVKLAPIRLPTGRGRKRDQRAVDEDGEIDFDDFLGGDNGSDKGQEEETVGQSAESLKPEDKPGTIKKEESEGSATEDENDAPPTSKRPKPSPPEASSSSLISPQRPMEDFESLVAPGSNMVTEAIRDMLALIPGMANSLGGRQWDLAIKCLTRAREIASLEEEADQYNTFLRELKQKCKDSGGGRLTQFWKQKMADHGERGLIHREESEWSTLDKAEAESFIHQNVLTS